MTPTLNLRYAIKSVPAPEYGPDVARNEKVLQQYWSQTPTHKQVIAMSKGQAVDLGGEWRDVPVVAELGKAVEPKACESVQVVGQSQTSPETELVWCGCGDGYPADSFEAGIMASTGQCSNCSAALKGGAPEYAPKFDEAAFAKLTENGAKAWADVPDASAWVDELRGNTPERKPQ